MKALITTILAAVFCFSTAAALALADTVAGKCKVVVTNDSPHGLTFKNANWESNKKHINPGETATVMMPCSDLAGFGFASPPTASSTQSSPHNAKVSDLIKTSNISNTCDCTMDDGSKGRLAGGTCFAIDC